MNNKVIVLVMLSVIIVAITLSGCITRQKTIETPGGKVSVNEGGVGPNWCKTGTKVTSTGPTGQQGSFEIKGITKHNGTEVCEAEYKYDNGSMVEFFNEKGDYMVLAYKDKSGKTIQEINTVNPKS